jgi:hypothetical protein
MTVGSCYDQTTTLMRRTLMTKACERSPPCNIPRGLPIPYTHSHDCWRHSKVATQGRPSRSPHEVATQGRYSRSPLKVFRTQIKNWANMCRTPSRMTLSHKEYKWRYNNHESVCMGSATSIETIRTPSRMKMSYTVNTWSSNIRKSQCQPETIKTTTNTSTITRIHKVGAHFCIIGTHRAWALNRKTKRKQPRLPRSDINQRSWNASTTITNDDVTYILKVRIKPSRNTMSTLNLTSQTLNNQP